MHSHHLFSSLFAPPPHTHTTFASQLENEKEKLKEAYGMKQGGQCVPCGEVEEEDPLDAYMRDHVVKEAEEASPTPICHIPHISHMSHPTFSPIDHTDFPPLMSTIARPHPPTHPTPPHPSPKFCASRRRSSLRSIRPRGMRSMGIRK